MRQRLSALHDGELDAAETGALLAGMRHDVALRAAWGEYCLLGDALRAEAALATEMTARVMSALQDEPTIMAPRAWWRRVHGPALALAASVSGVALVAWLAFAPQGGRQPMQADSLAQVKAPPGQSRSPAPVEVAVVSPEYPAAQRPRVRLVCLADER